MLTISPKRVDSTRFASFVLFECPSFYRSGRRETYADWDKPRFALLMSRTHNESRLLSGVPDGMKYAPGSRPYLSLGG